MSIIHVVSCSTGKDSQATLNIAVRRFGRRNVRAIFCDTDNEDIAVHKHLKYLESATGVRISVLKADFSERMEIHRLRLLDIAKGGPDYHPQAKFPWTPERAARAAEIMYPTGNAFLDLCMIKGMFPSHNRQFCTEELKRNIAVEYQLDLMDQGHTVVTWQGVRRDESIRRQNVAKFERLAPNLYAYRPIVDWTAEQTFEYIKACGQRPNALYKQGMARVGCMPCINVGKQELKQIALRLPGHIVRIASWEEIVKICSRAGHSSFLHTGQAGGTSILERVEWAKTTHGGKQYDLLGSLEDSTACSSAYGLCE